MSRNKSKIKYPLFFLLFTEDKNQNYQVAGRKRASAQFLAFLHPLAFLQEHFFSVINVLIIFVISVIGYQTARITVKSGIIKKCVKEGQEVA